MEFPSAVEISPIERAYLKVWRDEVTYLLLVQGMKQLETASTASLGIVRSVLVLCLPASGPSETALGLPRHLASEEI
jgi:hypothetical protein